MNGPQPYPPVGPPETRSASTPANGMPPGGPPTQSPAQPPPPVASAPPPVAPPNVSNSQPVFTDPLAGVTDMPWAGFDDPLLSMSMSMNSLGDGNFEEEFGWLRSDPTNDIVGGL